MILTNTVIGIHMHENSGRRHLLPSIVDVAATIEG